jgi:subfamily B ATP-binding cassette protein MsbA
VRNVVESGYDIGSRIADANERIQQYAQAGTQGIRDVKLFALTGEFRNEFRDAVDQYAAGRVTGSRNESAIRNVYQFLAATSVFVLIYLALTVAGLSLAAMGLFLFAMFRLVPHISSLNGKVYRLDRNLPHLVRTQAFIDELAEREEPRESSQEMPSRLDEIAFEDVSFSYDATEKALREVSFSVERSEFVAFVGPSGAGKSTVAALLARLYEPTAGCITANDVHIDEFDVRQWRSAVAIVRQQPYMFDDTLRWNVTVGNRDVTQAEIERACEAAQVTEFLDDLPNGYETVIGDDGVRLSGGQRQRVAIARALLKDADVLVLDEATSDLDAALEARIHDAIVSEETDTLCFVIAHRLSTITNTDRIYVMQNGRIVARGGHSALINDNETYTNLYETQMHAP